MSKEEFYKQNEVSQEEMERLKRIEYPNFISINILDGLDIKGKKMLDSGSGPNSKLAEYTSHREGEYVPMDLRSDVLKQMRDQLKDSGVPFYGVEGDARNIPFGDEAFDLAHQRFVLMNINKESRAKALKELLRVSKDYVVLIEYNWRTVKSTGSPEIIEKFKNLAFSVFAKFSMDPYMGEQFADLLRDVDPELKYSLRHFEREESVENTAELIFILRSMYGLAKGILKDEELMEKINELIDALEKSPIAFVPPEIVAAIIEK